MKTRIKKISISLMAAIICSTIYGHAQFLKGDGNVTKTERKIESFSYIEIEDGIDLYLSQGEKIDLTVEADKNLHEYIVTEIKKDVLKIYLSKNINHAKSLKVYLKMIELKGISASGGSDVETSGILKLDNLVASCSGGSDLRLAIETNELTINASGGSDGILRGKTKTLKANVSGGSDLKAQELESTSCSVESSGGSDAYVYATVEIIARGSGGSDIYLKGNPEKVDVNMSGGSDFSRQ